MPPGEPHHVPEARFLDARLLGEDLDRAANLYKKYGLAVMIIRQDKNLSSWFDLLPAAVIRNRPWLCILQAWLHYSIGSRARAGEFLQMVEQLIEHTPPEPELRLANHSASAAEQQRLAGAVAAIRAHIAVIEKDFQSVLAQVSQAFDHLPDGDSWHTTAMVAQGLAYWALVPTADGKGLYLLNLYRTRIDPPTGMLGGVLMGKVRDGIETGVKENLKMARERLAAAR